MRVFALCCLLCLTGLPAWADARVSVLMDALRLPDLVNILREEGVQDAQGLNEDMLNGQGGAFWQGQVDALYDATAMQDVLYAALLKGLEGDALEETVRFFDSTRGQRIVQLEIAARRAMMAADVQDAASEAYAALDTAADPHAALVAQFIEVNDLLELNVTVTMSTSYQFYAGLSDGGFDKRTEAEILSEIWTSEDTVRDQAQDWLFAYFLLAYQPLETSDLKAYLAFSMTPAGEALNRALFSGFEAIFKDIAYGLGRAVALNAVGNDI